MNRATILLCLILSGTLGGLLVHWTANVTFESLKAACAARGGDVIEFGNDKVCVRSERSRSPM